MTKSQEMVQIFVRYFLALAIFLAAVNTLFPQTQQITLNPKTFHALQNYLNTVVFLPAIILIELAATVCLLTKKWAPFGTLLIFPVLSAALLFQMALAPVMVLPIMIIFLADVFLLFSYREHYKPMFMKEIKVIDKTRGRQKKESSTVKNVS